MKSATGNAGPELARDDAVLDRVLGGLAQRQHFVVEFEVGEIEPGHPLDGRQRVVQRAAQLLGQRRELRPARHRIEPAQAHVDRMDRPPADEFHQRIAGLLQSQPTLDDLALVSGHGDRVRIAEEVRRVQQIDVQHVAVDPFAAVQQPAQCHQFRVDRDAAGVFDRVARADLVGDRADPADPGGEVRRLGMGTPAQERFEKPGRLIDVEFDAFQHTVFEGDVQRPFPFDAGERPDTERAGRWVHRALRCSAKLATLNVANTRSTSPSDMPSRRSSGISVAVCGVADGPKQP